MIEKIARYCKSKHFSAIFQLFFPKLSTAPLQYSLVPCSISLTLSLGEIFFEGGGCVRPFK